jgi:DNA-binding MarR family transcriptional regulator
MNAQADPQWLNAQQQRVWRDYLRVSRLLPAQLNRELQASSGLSAPEYEVLVNLSEAPGGRLRPFQLGEATQWEQSRLSHQLTRMQRRGLILREDCPKDGRGAFIVLTPAGRSAIESAAPAHAAGVLELVFSRLSDEEVAAFGQVCEKILQAVAETGAPSPCDADPEAGGDARPAVSSPARPGKALAAS